MHPVAIAMGLVAAAGAGFGFWQHKKNKAVPPPSTPPVTPAGNVLTPPAQPPAVNLSQLPPLPTGYTNYGDWIQKSSPATPAAHALYDYLKAHGVDNQPDMHRLTTAFQKAHNASPVGQKIGGQLDTDGEYDALTSAALTIYTGDPIPGDPQALPPKQATLGQILTSVVPGQSGTNVSAAYQSGYNVNQWLEKNGTSNLLDPTLMMLVMQFQHDVNTDPQFPGPAYAISPKPPIVFPVLPMTGHVGDKGSATRKALQHIQSPDSKLYPWY